jgi:isocitrate/isopropylmalate dehydrogenase
LRNLALLAWLEERGRGKNFADAAGAIVAAVDATLADPASRTADLGGPLGTKAFAAKVVEALAGRR